MGLGIKGMKMEVVFIIIPNDPLGNFYYMYPGVTRQVFEKIIKISELICWV